MQIIVVPSPLRPARTVTLGWSHLLGLMVGGGLTLIAGVAALYYLTLNIAIAFDLPVLRNLVQSANAESNRSQERRFHEHLQAMAARLGEVQAQMMRLDAFGERVSSLVGIKPQEFGFGQAPGRGGPSPALAARNISVTDLQFELDRMASELDNRTQDAGRFESVLIEQSMLSSLVPSQAPVVNSYIGSGFGWRLDPFTGARAKHDGIDFAAPVGTPIVAAAGGVVIAAERHPEYGNMIDISHGNQLVTRYAHASKLLVKAGDIVKRGQHIADVGSTGRSTGAHLHFEVHVKGSAQDPAKFLAKSNSLVVTAKR